MDVKELKRYIYENRKIEVILEDLQMHHIKYHQENSYYSCGMPDGDNISSTLIYDNESLNVTAYTRNIVDSFGVSDLISLVIFIKKTYFSFALKYLCELLGLNYYDDFQEEQDKAQLFVMKMSRILNNIDTEDEDDNFHVKPINEKILSYYYNVVNGFFKKDNIPFYVQKEFEIGYDLNSNRITIPIRDEFGSLVGVKGRLWKEKLDKEDQKYLYLENCAKSKILFGLNKTIQIIREKQEVIVVESEKAVMQLWAKGIFNVVSIGGHKISQIQAIMLTRLDATVILAFDKDVLREEIITELNKLKFVSNRYYLYDDKNILEEKESPTDNFEKFEILYNNKFLFVG